MPVPAKRRSQSKGRRTRAHLALVTPKLTKCPKCHKPKRPHQICIFCGYYQGREIIKQKTKKKKEHQK